MSSPPEAPEPGKTRYGSGSDLQAVLLYRIRRSAAWMAFFTLVLAAGAGTAAWLFWNQLGVMQDQLDTLQDLSDKVQKSFDGSRAQSEALLAALQAFRKDGSERAWVGIESLSIGPLRSSEPLSVMATIRNSGRSPALDVVVSLNTQVVPKDGNGPAQRPPCTDCARLVLLPNGSLNVAPDSTEGMLTSQSVDRITSGLDNVTLSGRIDYRDADGRAHETLACFVYKPRASTFSACLAGNHLD
jgi:hypothetical protein